MGQRFAAGVLAVLLLTAGCLGGPSDGTTTEPSGETTTVAETTTAEPTYPDGFGASGVTNASLAASTHAEALLASEGFTFAFNVTRTNGGEQRGVYVSRVDLTDRQTRTYVSRPGTTYVQFFGEGTVHEKITQNGDTTYRSYNASIPLNGTTGRSTVEQLLSGVEYGEATAVEGGYEYESASLRDAEGIVGVKRANVSEFSATVFVRESGVVETVSYTATYTKGGQERTVTAALSVRAVGSTDVERPDWTART